VRQGERGQFPVTSLADVVDGVDFRRAPLLRLERPKAVPTTDVQDLLAAKVQGIESVAD
jgi:hypothetical protein